MLCLYRKIHLPAKPPWRRDILGDQKTKVDHGAALVRACDPGYRYTMSQRGKSRPQRLGRVLESVVARLGLDRDLDDYRLWQAWDEVVGPAVARNAQPVRLDARRLVVAVRNNVWMQELSLLREQLCARLNEWMGRDVVGEIFLVVGKIEPPAQKRPAPRPAQPRTTPAAEPDTGVPEDGSRRLEEAIARLWRAARNTPVPPEQGDDD
ncbi:MAG: DUF721 domain-containing protein [Deltaproteobacteria bacterium]|nr:MAG: DUF721 domain-containing protein [Deltaproteobacteria bacterium]